MKKLLLLLAFTFNIEAQLPYPTIPNYTGTNAGLQFRNAVNSNFNYVNTQLISQGTLITLREATANKGIANGYAGLDSGAKVPVANTPAAGLSGVLKYTSGVPTIIGTSSSNCVHEDGSSGSCGSASTPITNIVYLSRIAGINANGSLTASTGTDDKAAIQTVLNTASASAPLLLVLDGVAAIYSDTSGLVVKSYTTIRGLGTNTGFCWLGGASTSQKPLFTNANPVGTGAVTDKDINFENFTVNGNIATTHGNGVNTVYSGTLFLSSFRLVGVDGLRFENIKTYRSPGYGIHLANVTNFYVNNYRVEHSTGILATDGLHINGPSSNGVINHVNGISGDDMVSIVTEDCHALVDAGCYQAYGDNSLASTVKVGAITRVIVDGIYLEDGLSGFRLISANSLMDDVTVRNVFGTTYGVLAQIDNYGVGGYSSSAGNYGTITVENFDVRQTTSSIYPQLKLNAKFRQLNLDMNCKDHTLTVPVITTGSATNIYNLDLNVNCSNSSGLPAPFMTMSAGTINNLRLKGHYDPNGGTTQSTNPILSVTGGTISNTIVDGFITDRMNNLITNAGGTLTSVLLMGGRHTNASGNATVLNTSGTLTNFSSGSFQSSLYTSGTIANNFSLRTFPFSFTGITATTTGCGLVPYAGVLKEVRIRADVSGSASVAFSTILDSSWAGNTSGAVSIGTETLTTATGLIDTTLSGFTTALAANTNLCVTVSGLTTATQLKGVLIFQEVR